MTAVTPTPYPILYSFRRCPYAMRARMMIYFSRQKVELRDILLKDKPDDMVAASPKATVPVLVLKDGVVLEESRDIMIWALEQNDPDNLNPSIPAQQSEITDLLDENDGAFKSALDRYKYHVRFPEKSREDYRREGERFLQKLEDRLTNHTFLITDAATMADIGIFPFVRQFANSDRGWFDDAPYPKLQKWLDQWLTSDAFGHIMKKRPIWQTGQPPCFYPDLLEGRDI